jgi:hypothetical protein
MIDQFLGYIAGRINDWGPGLLIALIMLYGLYKLLLKLGKDVGLKIVGALEKPTDALSQQAASMDRLTTSINDYVSRDANEHQEIIILQKVIRRELIETRSDLIDIKKQSDRIEKSLGEIPHGRS